jgi:HlyD family secretion protein
MRLEQEKLDKYVAQLAKTKIRASVSGMVVYTRQEGRGMGGDQPMQEGSQVRERQEILTIPREGGMIVEASIHESVLKQVGVGAPCTIHVDAAPGKEFIGKVSFVALLPDKGSWWANPNLRLYKTEIVIDHPAVGSETAIKDLRPGMSCSIEIHSARIEDAIFIPLQSVFIDKGESIAFVAVSDTPERRVLQVGRSNDKFVEITSGVKEGEEVLLSAPPGFSPSGADDTKKDGGAHGVRPAPNGAAAPGAPSATVNAMNTGEHADGAAPTADAQGEATPNVPGATGASGAPGANGDGRRVGGGRPRDGSGMPGGGRRDGARGPGRGNRDQVAPATGAATPAAPVTPGTPVTTGTGGGAAAEKTESDKHATDSGKGDGKQR